MKYLASLFTIAFFLYLSVNSVLAQSPTSEPADTTEASNSSDEAIQQNLKDRLKKVIEEKSDRIKGITDGASKRGFIGTVKRISEEALTLDTPRGPVVLTILSDIQFWDGKKSIARTDIEIEKQVVVIGAQNNDEFIPERIYLSQTPLRPSPRTIVLGSVKKLDKNSLSIASRTGDDLVFSVNTKTRYTNADGESIKSTDFTSDQDVIVIAIPEDSATQTLKESNGRVTLIRLLAKPESAQ